MADVALDVLDRLADAPHRQGELLCPFLDLAAAYGDKELADDVLRTEAH